MLSNFKILLRLLKITDEESRISLSSILVWVMLIKFALLPAFTVFDLAGLALVLLNYNARKFWRSKRHEYADETLAAMNNLNAKIDRTQAQVQALQNVSPLAAFNNQFKG